MIHVRLSKAAACLAACTLCAVAGAAPVCKPLAGLLRLDPDAACTIASRNAGHAYVQAPGTCFTVKLLGGNRVPMGQGHAGLTVETTISPLAAVAASTPLVLSERGVAQSVDEFGLPESRRVFTARSAIAMGGDGDVYTADVGVVHGQTAIEQIIITGGTGLYAGATGSITATGNMIQAWAPFFGKVCTGA